MKLIAVSDLDLDCIRQGALLKAGRAVLAVFRDDASRDRVKAEVIEAGEFGCGDSVTFERTGAGNAGVITVSDTCSEGGREDLSGPALVEALEAAGFHAVRYAIEPDDRERISGRLRSWCDDCSCDIILTTGGTGLSPRDITPEATLDVLERVVPGIPEMIRLKSAETVPNAWLSRAVAGIRTRTLMVNLPGSRRGAVESFSHMLPILGHAIEVAGGKAGRCGG